MLSGLNHHGISACLAILTTASTAPGQESAKVIRQIGSIRAPEAHQAAAVDGDAVYAIDSTRIAKYDRRSGERLAVSTGDAKHLNSGFFHEGKLYCAHSNYPQRPEKSEIRVLDPTTMVLGVFKDFGESQGSLTWAVRRGESWWCTFAYYGKENARTRLVEFDSKWKEIRAWTYPAEVTRELGSHSISGGFWMGDHLLATGHDRRVVYRLRLPREGSVLELVEVLKSPFPGQGIAAGSKPGEIVGIDRARGEVLFGELHDSR